MLLTTSNGLVLRYQRTCWCAVVCAIALSSIAGCDKGRPTRLLVSGKVLLDGEPLPNCAVQFSSPAGRSSFGQADEQGVFSLGCYEENDGVLPGTHRVVVVAKNDIDGATIEWLAPKKYINHDTSGLEFTIEKPTDDLVIELTWDGDKPFREVHGRRVGR